MINWKVRIRNQQFWLGIIPAVLLLVQALGALFGYQWDFVVLSKELTALVNAAFGVLALVGVVADPTTAGLGDSTRALRYDEPSRG